MNKSDKAHLRAKLVKKFKKGNKTATKEEFRGLGVGINMCFDVMFKKYKYWKEKCQQVDMESAQKVSERWDLNYCKKCKQMTNHRLDYITDGRRIDLPKPECLKCKVADKEEKDG